jgi:hypothetical protein
MTLYQKSRSIYVYLYGPNNINEALILNNIGGLYERTGDLDKAN